jgi:hypothetical protein
VCESDRPDLKYVHEGQTDTTYAVADHGEQVVDDTRPDLIGEFESGLDETRRSPIEMSDGTKERSVDLGYVTSE